MKKIKREKVTLEQLAVIDGQCRRRRCFQSISFMIILLVTMIGCCMSSYMIFDDGKADYIERTYNETSVDYLYTDYTVSENFKNKMITFIESLPEDMKTRIKEDWTIVVCKEIPANLRTGSLFALENYDTSNLLNGGFTYNSNRIVYVCSAFKEDVAYSSFVHEIGHLTKPTDPSDKEENGGINIWSIIFLVGGTAAIVVVLYLRKKNKDGKGE